MVSVSAGLRENEEYGAFGRIYREFYHDAAGAIRKLTEEQSGKAVAALYHPDVGDIDVVWGKAGDSRNTGYGLAKIVQYHPEVLPNLQKILLTMRVKQRDKNKIHLCTKDCRAAINLLWDGQKKHGL
jgi:hypothetical protein